MNLFSALSKLFKRKKKDGYYESSYILTTEEKNSLLIVSISILVPIIIAGVTFLMQ